MLDFRYHALSLIAVFLALTIGLLLGVAIGDRELVSSAGRDVRESLRGDVREAQLRAADLRRELGDRRQYERDSYPLLVEGQLVAQRIGFIALGDVPNETIRLVRDALKDTGGRLTAVAVVGEPIDVAELERRVPGLGDKPAPTPPDTARRFGLAFGSQLITGGKLIGRVRRELLSSSSGSLAGGIDAVVVVRAPDEDTKRDEVTTAFEDGLMEGLTDRDVPVVGAETTTVKESQIGWFKDHRASSVDDVDDVSGQAALVFALAGASGAYGVKPSAEALLPRAAGETTR